jgi:CRISPR-associated endonuclease/helicase Cas3
MYAHSTNKDGKQDRLKDHLESVAVLAADLAKEFQAESWGYVAGLLHDLGKGQPGFQDYLKECQDHPGKMIRGPDHSSAGAVLAWQRYWEALACLLAGHHGGLPSHADLKDRIQKKSIDPGIQKVIEDAEKMVALPERPAFPVLTSPTQAELFLRFLFSALVDADYLRTEAHFDSGKSRLRHRPVDFDELANSFWKAQEKLSGHDQSPVNLARHEIYQACLTAAECPPGIFRLTVPTGGGKTLSGMAFALRHALKYQKHRMIVAIPYTSIIDQTAQVYRGIFGEAVLEHHSALVVPDGEEEYLRYQWARLAAENWDAPIVVTTTVQLFESLFSNRPAACRKLHNLAQSIIILDEVQTLPTGLLAPILEVVQELADYYGVTVVLSTATQPSLVDSGSPYLKGLHGEKIRGEIVPDPARYFQALKRVSYDCPGEPWGWERVAQEMAAEPQCLTVVNTKKDALALLEALKDPEALHLSTLLCMAHRREVIAEIKRRLDPKNPVPCRVVATQVVEAGVDLDFPVVLRAMGPLDRIVQAAGRCNREGGLLMGRVVIFEAAEGHLPCKRCDYQTATDLAASFLNRTGVDLHDPKLYEAYFKELYVSVETDVKNINELRARLNFPEVAARFKLIEDDSVPLVVRYPQKVSPVDDLLRRLQTPEALLGGKGRLILRRLQPYLVNVRRGLLRRYQQQGLVGELPLGLWEWLGNYHPVKGLHDEALDPEPLVI